MTVTNQDPAQSIFEAADSLRTTPLVMHRITFEFKTLAQWYAVMSEARKMFGRNWRSQPRTKRRIEQSKWTNKITPVWFEVPDPAFATWCAVKYAVIVVKPTGK